MNENRIKKTRQFDVIADSLEDSENVRLTKVNRIELDAPIADIDLRLAEKLDRILKIGGPNKSKFFINKPKERIGETVELSTDKLKRRNFSKEELKERVARRYDTLVDSSGWHKPRVVKVLTASESVELGRDQAIKQIEREMEMNSVSGNISVQRNLLER